MDITENVGFIGTGGIASAMAKGFCTSPRFKGKVLLSVHRNPQRAERLKAQFPDKVEIHRSNQEIADGALIVAPCILPAKLKEVVTAVRFRKEHRIIHLAAGTSLALAKKYCAPAEHVVRTVPMPFSSMRMGPLVFYGDDPLLEDVLGCIGTVLKVKEEKDLSILAAVTGLMVPYYQLVATIAEWCGGKGMDEKTAADFTCLMHEALAVLMRSECDGDFEAFMDENTTPGGTNEMALSMLKEAGVYEPWKIALEKIGKRYDI